MILFYLIEWLKNVASFFGTRVNFENNTKSQMISTLVKYFNIQLEYDMRL